MKNATKKLRFMILILSMSFYVLHAVTADESIQIHKVNTTEMNNIIAPLVGSLVYNTAESTLYFYTGVTWKRLRFNGTETILNAGSGMTVLGNGSSVTPYSIGFN